MSTYEIQSKIFELKNKKVSATGTEKEKIAKEIDELERELNFKIIDESIQTSMDMLGISPFSTFGSFTL